MRNILILLVALSITLNGCKDRGAEREAAEIAVTNSYLQCVVKDLWPDEQNVLCLTPPGMCPGHFDISPAQVDRLRKCKILLRFDFQKGIDDSLLRMKGKGLRIASVRALPGLCVPRTYLGACQDVCHIFSSEYPERNTQYHKRIKQIEKRLENLSKELVGKLNQTGLAEVKVLASEHQAEFARWLGLEVVATFLGGDVETISNINQCIEKAGQNTVGFVVANRQEGTALADALGRRLAAKVVVFSNFPDLGSGQDNFDELLAQNVQALLEAAKPR